MSTLNYSDQLYHTGKGYMDAKIQPVKTISELNNIPRADRFVGLTITVLDDGLGLGPRDYWIKESTSKWVLKEMPSAIMITGDDVEMN